MEAKFQKQTYGAVVATIIETDDSIVEVQERNDGVYGLIIHARRNDDRWDDLTAYLKSQHFEALGSVARRMRGEPACCKGLAPQSQCECERLRADRADQDVALRDAIRETASTADELAFWRYQAIFGRACMLEPHAMGTILLEESAVWREATKQLEEARAEENRERMAGLGHPSGKPDVSDQPEPCTDTARALGCTCTIPHASAYDIDPPEPKRSRDCPLHGNAPDADEQRERRLDRPH